MLTAGEDDRRSPGTCHDHAANPQRSPVLVSPDASLSDRGVSTDEFDSKSPAAYSPRSYRGNYPIWRGVVVPQAPGGDKWMPAELLQSQAKPSAHVLVEERALP